MTVVIVDYTFKMCF